jgi:hypothetical protein
LLARISTTFDCTTEQLWDEISCSASLRFIAAPLLHFEPLVSGDTRWNGIFKIAGIAAVTMLVYSLVTMVLPMMIGDCPETAQEGFNLLQENRLVGLLRVDLFTILAIPLYYVLLVGAFAALRKIQIGYALLALVLGCAGVTLVLATPSALSLF